MRNASAFYSFLDQVSMGSINRVKKLTRAGSFSIKTTNIITKKMKDQQSRRIKTLVPVFKRGSVNPARLVLKLPNHVEFDNMPHGIYTIHYQTLFCKITRVKKRDTTKLL